MNKKIRKILFASVLVLCFIFSGCLGMYKEEETSISWEPEKSHFVDYEIDGDRIKFRYSIHFANDYDEDITISLSVKFKSKELKKWVKADKDIGGFFNGCDQNGEMLYTTIKAGEQVDIVYVFIGEYLGGEVNENLSFPETIVLSSQIAGDSSLIDKNE